MITVTNELQLKEAILSFNETVKIDSYNPQQLIESTYKKFPEVLVYLAGLNGEPSFFGGVTVRFTYINQDVPLKFIKQVDDYGELMEFFHDAVSNYRLKMLAVLTSSINVANAFSDFKCEYEGYYSNLSEIGLQVFTPFDSTKSVVVLECSYRIGSVMLGIMERAVDNEVARLRKILFCKEMSDGVKAYVAHNYLAKSVTYYDKDDASPLERSYMQSAYGALINKKCVCQGYAEAFKRLMDEEGIKCAVLCGKLKGEESYHAWNVVFIKGKCYHVDVTWDSCGNGVKTDEHFAKSDQFFIPTRLWERTPKYICNDNNNILPEIRADIIMNTRKYILAGVDKNYLR